MERGNVFSTARKKGNYSKTSLFLIFIHSSLIRSFSQADVVGTDVMGGHAACWKL